MNFGRAIKAARNYLGMSQPELAEVLRMSSAGILGIEKGETTPQANTHKKLINYFMLRGITFENDAICIKSNSIITIDGKNWWNEVLADVHETLKNNKDKEVLFLFSDDSLSPHKVNEQMKAMRNDGITMRQIIKEDNTFMMGYENEYKWMPKEYFALRVSLVYADKYVVCAEDNTKAVIFKDAGLADQIRNMFNFMWSNLPNAKRSTANERF